MRSIQQIEVRRHSDLVVIDVTANAFLHHMVRNISGVLIAVGTGKQPVSWVDSVLKARDRKLGAETAPPYGLYLVHAQYPQEFRVLQPHIGPLFLLGN